MSDVRISNDQAELDVEVIHRFLSEESHWARGISLDLVRRSIAHSINFGLFIGDAQVGYARVVTDYAGFAWLQDVFVLKSHRGRGLSRTLVAAVVAHPALRDVRRFMLVSSTARGLYEKFGFTAPARPEIIMERTVPT
ncbi:MAG: GNAT family N-acetyltransferase [Rhodocyclaceae bacterium]|jgi:GNAT superfamily N-acetyltransferase|nr:GNAT family N-acetyltransferase [Rhodocyclaceae bacterium]MCE2978289.1 GNAT family N-acetyltransferase [Betaproteobacteria bacterium]MCA3075923.1 GNAT family N-acetyltransferase [Rhodocyclaceae bacterium]MCA3088451.1 GNAT family N-acetyltransferase [Rhodocyclaceae bacterium]MCA3094351.1 GNAT family N-acetyltransferase [Rhodocyclaceae bacterium]